MARKLNIFIFVNVILAPVLLLHAQQPAKVHRIGFLTVGSVSTKQTFADMLFAKACASLDMWRAKTL